MRVTLNAHLVVKNYGDIFGAKLLLEDTLNSLYNTLSDLLNRLEREEVSPSELIEGYEWPAKKFGNSVRWSFEVSFLPRIYTVGGYESDPLRTILRLLRPKAETDTKKPYDISKDPLREFDVKKPKIDSYEQYNLERIKEEIRTFLNEFEDIKKKVMETFEEDLSSFLEKHGHTEHLKFGPVSLDFLDKPIKPSYVLDIVLGEVPLSQFGKMLVEELSPPRPDEEEEEIGEPLEEE